MKAPKKIFVNPHALQNSGYDGKDYMFIQDSVFDESKCTIEYIRTDTFVEKACEWLRNNSHNYADNALGKEYLINDFKNYMKGE